MFFFVTFIGGLLFIFVAFAIWLWSNVRPDPLVADLSAPEWLLAREAERKRRAKLIGGGDGGGDGGDAAAID